MGEVNVNSEYLLTIAIPTYNRAKLLIETLDNVLLQVSSVAMPIEVLVVDNASTDDTQVQVKNFPVKYIRNNENLGIDGNINKCVYSAAGEYVHVLSDDDLLVDGALQEILCKIENKPDFIFLNGYVFSEDPLPMSGKPKIFNRVLNEKVENHDEFVAKLGVWATFVSSFVTRREAWLAVKGVERYLGTDILLAYVLYDLIRHSRLMYIVRTPCVAIRAQFSGNYRIIYAFSYQWAELLAFYAPSIGYSRNITLKILRRSFVYDLVPRLMAIGSENKIKVDSEEYRYLVRGFQSFPALRIFVLALVRLPSPVQKVISRVMGLLNFNNLNASV